MTRPTMRLMISASGVSATSPSPALRPSRRIVTRSAMRRVSSRRCDTKTTAMPRALSCSDDAEERVDLVVR